MREIAFGEHTANTAALVASQEDYIDPDSFHDDDNYVEPEEHPAGSKEALVLIDRI